MLADFELNEINRLNQVIDQDRARMVSLLQMLRAVSVDAWLDPDGEITVVNRALEAPKFDWAWWSTGQQYPPALLGAGYMGLGADGT